MITAALVNSAPAKSIASILLDLFDDQVDNLITKDFHVPIGMDEFSFRRMLAPLLDYLMRLSDMPSSPFIANSPYMPILLVIPHSMISRESQMSTVRCSTVAGDSNLKVIESNIDRASREIQKPYLLINVDVGSPMQGVSPKDCLQFFKSQRRFPLTIDEGVALAVHNPESVLTHSIDLPGTTCGHGLVASLRHYKNKITVMSTLRDMPSDRAGSASSGGKIILR